MSISLNFGLSLDLVDLDHQEPNRNRRESKYYWDELLSLIPAAGFQAIELPYQPKWDFGGRSGIPFTQYAVNTKYGSAAGFNASLREKGINKVAGLCFNPSLFMSSNLDAYFGAFGHFAGQAVQYAGEVGADVLTLTPTPCYGQLVFHLGKTGDWTAVKADFLKRSADLISQLARQASAAGIKIALKNEYWSLLRETGAESFFAGLDSNHVALDLDTAHIQIAGGLPAQTVLRQAGRIGCVHLTDTSFTDAHETWREANPEHPSTGATQVFRDLGQGSVDLLATCQALQSTGYAGWTICSCRQTRDAMRAMLRARQAVNQIIAKL